MTCHSVRHARSNHRRRILRSRRGDQAPARRGSTTSSSSRRPTQLGGTWRENTYPGCACDVPSHLYSYSFAPKTSWSRVFAEQAEIQAYLLEVADKYGVMPHVRFETEMLRSDWDATRNRWKVTTNKGAIEAQFIVMGQGPLHEPKLPDVPGHRDVQRHDVSLRAVEPPARSHRQARRGDRHRQRRRSSSCRRSSRRSEQLDAVPAHRAVGAAEARPRSPASARNGRCATCPVCGSRCAARSTARPSCSRSRSATRRRWGGCRRSRRRHIERQVKDPELRAAVTPTFTLGCKRLLLSNTYYPAIQAPNAELVAHGVSRDHADRRDRQRGRRARGRHDHLRHRLPRHRQRDAAQRVRHRWQERRRGVGREPDRVPRHDDRAGSRTRSS